MKYELNLSAVLMPVIAIRTLTPYKTQKNERCKGSGVLLCLSMWVCYEFGPQSSVLKQGFISSKLRLDQFVSLLSYDAKSCKTIFTVLCMCQWWRMAGGGGVAGKPMETLLPCVLEKCALN